MIGRRLVPPTSSKGAKDINSNQVKSAENRKQQKIWKEVEIKEQAWSPMASPTPSWSELSLYWSEGSVSSRSQSSPSFSSLLTFRGPTDSLQFHNFFCTSLPFFSYTLTFLPNYYPHPLLSFLLMPLDFWGANTSPPLSSSLNPFCPQTFFSLHPLLLPALPHPLQHQDWSLHLCQVVKVF